MEPNMQDEQPANEPVQTDDVAAPAPDTNQVPQDDASASNATSQNTNDSDEIEDDDDVDWDSQVSPQAPAQNVQPNDEGYIDPIAYKEQIKAEVREDIKFQERERRAWNKLEERYPELKGDRDARQLVLAKRLFDIQNGGNGSLLAAGKAVMGRFTTAQQRGKSDAQVSIRQQQAAGVSRATAPRDTSSDNMRDRLRSGDSGAIQDVVEDMLAKGKI